MSEVPKLLFFFFEWLLLKSSYLCSFEFWPYFFTEWMVYFSYMIWWFSFLEIYPVSDFFRIFPDFHQIFRFLQFGNECFTSHTGKPKRLLLKFSILANLWLAYNIVRYLKWKLHLSTSNHILFYFLWGLPQEPQKPKTTGSWKTPAPMASFKGQQPFFKPNFGVQTNIGLSKITLNVSLTIIFKVGLLLSSQSRTSSI